MLSKNLKIKIYKTIILPVVLHGFETLSLTLSDERTTRVLENRVLRRISGPTKDNVTVEYKKLRNEELTDMYYSPYIIRMIKSRRMRRVEHVARVVERRSVYRVLVGKYEGKRPLGRPRRRWEENIKMDLQEVVWGEWTGLIWLRVGTGGGHL